MFASEKQVTTYDLPILACFAEMESRYDGLGIRARRSSQRMRIKWLVALTLARNPQLAPERKRMLQGAKGLETQHYALMALYIFVQNFDIREYNYKLYLYFLNYQFIDVIKLLL